MERDLCYQPLYDALDALEAKGGTREEYLALVRRAQWPSALAESAHMEGFFVDHPEFARELYDAWIEHVLEYRTFDGEAHAQYWNRFATFARRFGARLSSEQLEAMMTCSLEIDASELGWSGEILQHSAKVLSAEQQSRFEEAYAKLEEALESDEE